MSRTRIRWARVEYQSDLTKPAEPIPLGVIVEITLANSGGFVIVGREPNRNRPPAELKDVGPLGLAQLVGWVNSAGQDIVQAHREGQDSFSYLASRWHWNLYVTEAEELEEPVGASLLRVARRHYQKYMRAPFPENVPLMGNPQETLSRRPKAWVPAETAYAGPFPAVAR